jgi:hypothetical protein
MNEAAGKGVRSGSEVEPQEAECQEGRRRPAALADGRFNRDHATHPAVADRGKTSSVSRMALLSALALAASAAILACPVGFDALPVLALLICISLTIWHPAISRFTGALALASTVYIVFTILRRGLEERGLIPRSVLRGERMPDWGLYSKFGSMGSSEWIRFALSVAGLILLGGLALLALLGKLHEGRAQKR